MGPTDEQLAALEATHGRIGVVTHTDGKSWAVVLRKPKRGEYKQFRAQAADTVQRPMSQERLFVATCVYPSTPAEIDALLEDWPGIPEACGVTLMSLAGMTGTDSGK